MNINTINHQKTKPDRSNFKHDRKLSKQTLKKHVKSVSPSDSEETTELLNNHDKSVSSSEPEQSTGLLSKHDKSVSPSDPEEDEKLLNEHNKGVSPSDPEDATELLSKRDKSVSPSDTEDATESLNKHDKIVSPSDPKEDIKLLNEHTESDSPSDPEDATESLNKHDKSVSPSDLEDATESLKKHDTSDSPSDPKEDTTLLNEHNESDSPSDPEEAIELFSKRDKSVSPSDPEDATESLNTHDKSVSPSDPEEDAKLLNEHNESDSLSDPEDANESLNKHNKSVSPSDPEEATELLSKHDDSILPSDPEDATESLNKHDKSVSPSDPKEDAKLLNEYNESDSLSDPEDANESLNKHDKSVSPSDPKEDAKLLNEHNKTVSPSDPEEATELLSKHDMSTLPSDPEDATESLDKHDKSVPSSDAEEATELLKKYNNSVSPSDPKEDAKLLHKYNKSVLPSDPEEATELLSKHDKSVPSSNAEEATKLLKKYDNSVSPSDPEEATELPAKCPTELRRDNQRNNISSSIHLADDFKIAGEAKSKKTSSIHIGEDITLCWIETTTIKEDSAFDPPKRLVIREFTISFENSATIPEEYLECTKLEGEIEAGDENTVSKTAFHEVIEEDTRRSRVVNFTTVNHVGTVVIRQNKKVRCGVGGLVSKDIYEWPNGIDNPKRRVEIKVGPSLRDLRPESSEPGECPTETSVKQSNNDNDNKPLSDCISGESCEPSIVCKDGEDCSGMTTARSCEGEDCTAEKWSDETDPTQSPDSDDSLSTGVTVKSTTKTPDGSRNLDRADNESCTEDDPDCKLNKLTDPPRTYSQKDAKCSGEDCSDSSSKLTSDVPCDSSTESCQSKSAPDTDGTVGSGGISTESNEICEDGSCDCSGSSCSINSSGESSNLRPENQQLDSTTTFSESRINVTTAEPPANSADGSSITESDSKCGDESEECSSGYSLADGGNEKSMTTTPVAPAESSREADESKSPPFQTEPVQPCDDPESEDCTTSVPEHENISGQVPTGSDTDLTIESTAAPSKDGSEPVDRSEEIASACDDPNDESCQSTMSNDSGPLAESNSSATDTATDADKDGTLSPSIESEVSNHLNDEVTPIPTMRTAESTSRIETIAGAGPANENHSADGPSGMNCSSDSGDCDNLPSTPIINSNEFETTVPSSATELTTMKSVSCEFSGSCKSTEDISEGSGSNHATSTTSGPPESVCDSSTESCEPSLVTDTCEDGSAGDCSSTGNDSAIADSADCDPATESCTAEMSSPAGSDVETITTTQSVPNELEHVEHILNNTSTTPDTRRNTPPALFLSSPGPKKHRLALRIKVLLEHIDEKKQKEKLVQVEKHLLLNENPDENGNHSLLWQIKSLNNSMNLKTLKAILNCTNLGKLSEDGSDRTDHGPSQSKELNLEKLIDEFEDGTQDMSKEQSTEETSRKKRSFLIPEEFKNITDATKAKEIRDSLPGVQEDFMKGMNNVLSSISKELNTSATGAKKVTESSSSKILKVLADPADTRVHFIRRKRETKKGVIVGVEKLEHPVHGEEIARWSNERFLTAGNKGRVRSVTEFKVLRDLSND